MTERGTGPGPAEPGTAKEGGVDVDMDDERVVVVGVDGSASVLLEESDGAAVLVVGHRGRGRFHEHVPGLGGAAVGPARELPVFPWASSDDGSEPDVVLGCAGDVPPLEAVAAGGLLRRHLPSLRVRLVKSSI